MYLSRTFSLSHLDLFLIPTLSLLYKISLSKLLLCLFYNYLFIFKIGLMSRVPCGGRRSKVFSPIQTLYIKSESSTGLHPGRKDCITDKVGVMKCVKCCSRDKSAAKCQLKAAFQVIYQRQFKFKCLLHIIY